MIVRFVTKHGWEKWLDVASNLPPNWVLPEELVTPASFTEHLKQAKACEKQKNRVFSLQEWKQPSFPYEWVYVEDDSTCHVPDFYGPNHPSMHREREYRSVLEKVAVLVKESADRAQNPLGSLLSAAHVLEEIEKVLRSTKLAAPFFERIY